MKELEGFLIVLSSGATRVQKWVYLLGSMMENSSQAVELKDQGSVGMRG